MPPTEGDKVSRANDAIAEAISLVKLSNVALNDAREEGERIRQRNAVLVAALHRAAAYVGSFPHADHALGHLERGNVMREINRALEFNRKD